MFRSSIGVLLFALLLAGCSSDSVPQPIAAVPTPTPNVQITFTIQP